MDEKVQLPRWQSHKKVWADKIVKIGEGAILHLDCGGHREVPDNFFARGFPQVGDYYVRYEDGYESWSPTKAFEEGYTRID